VVAEARERIVEVVNSEHDTQVAQRVHGGVPVIGDHRGPNSVKKAMAVSSDSTTMPTLSIRWSAI
jgi:hypothetical protein